MYIAHNGFRSSTNQKLKSILLLTLIFVLNIFSAHVSAQSPEYLDTRISIDQRVNDVLRQMTIDEKIGQMMQVDLSVVNTNPSILTKYAIGSVLSGGGHDPVAGIAPINWADAYDNLQAAALKTRLRIPILYGIDAVHGHNNVFGATIFPHNIGLGCTRDPQLIQAAARATAEEIAATGIDWTFAPCLAVARDIRWGRTYEGFGETPELVQQLGPAAIQGFQGDSLTGRTYVLACAKHYLGDGGTENGIDRGNVQEDESIIRNTHLPGYVSAIKAGVGSIMVSYSSINGQKMHGSEHWLTEILKNELGFKGFVVSDWSGINQLDPDYKRCVELSINAGIDMVMIPYQYREFKNALRSLVDGGKISVSRIDDAVRRILTAKFRLGLFEKPFVNRSLLPVVGSPEHRAIARQCVRESIVLLKKKDGILPLHKKNVRILIAGDHADDIGNQCGGWTISWQGKNGNIIPGTTIVQGMKQVAPDAHIEFSLTGNFVDTHADYSVVVIGERPYAEAVGDRKDLSIKNSDIDLIKKMKDYGAPVIVILISGRPLILEKILHFSDVLFAAWLPGTEGSGVADLLFGDYQPKGRLSHTWPQNMKQVPLNIGDNNYSPLFEYGYGITSFENSPRGSSPVLLSSLILADGQHFECTFNKSMADPSLLQAKFILTRNQGTINSSMSFMLKKNDSTTIVVKLDSAYFTPHDLAVMTYAAGEFKSVDGGILQSYGPIEIPNFAQPETKNAPAKLEIDNYNTMKEQH